MCCLTQHLLNLAKLFGLPLSCLLDELYIFCRGGKKKKTSTRKCIEKKYFYIVHVITLEDTQQ